MLISKLHNWPRISQQNPLIFNETKFLLHLIEFIDFSLGYICFHFFYYLIVHINRQNLKHLTPFKNRKEKLKNERREKHFLYVQIEKYFLELAVNGFYEKQTIQEEKKWFV